MADERLAELAEWVLIAIKGYWLASCIICVALCAVFFSTLIMDKLNERKWRRRREQRRG